jgi:hypothetical protein
VFNGEQRSQVEESEGVYDESAVALYIKQKDEDDRSREVKRRRRI